MDVPRRLVVIRHAQSAGNVARDLALERGSPTIDIDIRDCDVPLSDLGERQAAALGRWWKAHEKEPKAVFSSPYVRAQQTAEIALAAAGWKRAPVVLDERLREKDQGALDRLTRAGIEARFPDEVTARARLGKFYYRPPGGESWTDVIQRVRAVYADIARDQHDRRVLVVAHQVIVLCLRYVVERLSEEAILAIDRAGEVANCGVTTYRREGDALVLDSYNAVAPVEEAGEAVTRSPDVQLGPR